MRTEHSFYLSPLPDDDINEVIGRMSRILASILNEAVSEKCCSKMNGVTIEEAAEKQATGHTLVRVDFTHITNIVGEVKQIQGINDGN